MEQIGTYKNIKVFYTQNPNNLDDFPKKDWICFFIANEKYKNSKIENFINGCIDRNMGEWFSSGKFGTNAENDCDLNQVMFNIKKNCPDEEFFSPTRSGEKIKECFWECFYANCLSDECEKGNVSVVCVTFDIEDYVVELKKYLEDFENG